MIKTCEELNQARVQAQLEIQSYACRILVCSGTGCIATGSHKIHERFEDLVKETPGIQLVFSPCGGHDGETVVGVKKTGCQGFCELGPLVRIQKGDKVIQYVKVQPEDCAEIVEKSVLGDEVIERLLYKKGEKVYVQPDEIPFIAKQTRIVLENCGKFDAESLDCAAAAAAASPPDGSGSRSPVRRRPCAMWSATATRATPARLWTAPLWKATPSSSSRA